MVRALGDHFDLAHVERQPWPGWHPLLVRVLLKLTGGRCDIGWFAPYVRLATRAMRRRLAQAKPDVVFAISAGELILALEEDFPVVNIADATGPLLTGYYPDYAAMTAARKRAINAGAICPSGKTSSAAPWAMASRGMPNTMQVASFCT